MRSLQTYILTLLCVVLALLGAGCGNSRVADKLAHADRLMEEHPDSARLLLDGIDLSKLSRANTSLYAVLDAQSRHKLDLTAPSDSLLNIAVDHYTLHGPDSLLMKALFYRGVVFKQSEDVHSAANDAICSWEVAKGIHNHYWQAKSAELLADLAFIHQNTQEELKWRKRAAENYLVAGKVENHLFSLCDVSTAYLNLHDSINSVRLSDSLHTVLQKYPDSSNVRTYHAYSALFIQNAYGTVARTDSLYRVLQEAGFSPAFDPVLHVVEAHSLLKKNKLAESRHILDFLGGRLATDKEKFMLYECYYQFGKSTEDPDLMAIYADSLLEGQFKLISKGLSQPVTASQRDYYQTVARTQSEARRKANVQLAGITALLILLLIFGACFYRYMMKRKNTLLKNKVTQIFEISELLKEQIRRNEATMAALSSEKMMNEDLREKIGQSEISDIQRQSTLDKQHSELHTAERKVRMLTRKLDKVNIVLTKIYHDRWKTLNMLCKEVIENGNTVTQAAWVNINTHLNKLKSREFYDTLEKDLDKYQDDIMKKLRSQYPEFSEENIQVCMLSFAGLGSYAIALLMSTTLNGFYGRRRRIIEKMEKQRTVDTVRFLEFLNRGKA